MEYTKHILKCRFCDKKVGELDLPKEQSFNSEMFADIRCSDCEEKYGYYKDIVLEAEQKLKGLVKDEDLPAKIKEFISDGEYKKDKILSKVDTFKKKELEKKEKEQAKEK